MSVTADAMDRSARSHDYGDQALLLEFDSTAEVLAWSDALREADLLGVVDIVPASRTVLLKLDGPRYQAPTRQRLSKLRVAPEARREAERADRGRADVVIDVVYDGADLDEVARLTGTDARRGGRRAHRHPVAGRIRRFRTGFRLPGRRLTERLNVPRRSEPRTKVPAGSVGLAGEFSGVYPRESPGGWQLIGRHRRRRCGTSTATQPALLTPGHVGPVPGGIAKA